MTRTSPAFSAASLTESESLDTLDQIVSSGDWDAIYEELDSTLSYVKAVSTAVRCVSYSAVECESVDGQPVALTHLSLLGEKLSKDAARLAHALRNVARSHPNRLNGTGK